MPMGLSLSKQIPDILDVSNIFEVSGSIQYFTGSVQEDQPRRSTLRTHIFQGKKNRESIRPLGNSECVPKVPRQMFPFGRW